MTALVVVAFGYLLCESSISSHDHEVRIADQMDGA
jgi:hypothetical protein